MFVELSTDGIRHVFELGAADDRAFLVGSSRQTDLCIDRPGVAAVEFHLERAGNDVWLVPAYRGRGLRVNGAPATNRMRLNDRLCVSVGALELELRALQNASEAGTSSRSSSAPRCLPADYSETVPTDTANTSIALKPFEAEPDASMPTLLVPTLRAVAAAVPDQHTQRIAPVRPAPLQSLQHTQRLEPSALLRPRPSQAAPQVLFETQRLAPVTTLLPTPAALEPAVLPSRVLPVLPEEATRSTRLSPLTTQDTSAFDMAALKKEEAQPTTFLTQLGVATRQRPLVILGGGLAASLVLALALVGGSRLAKSADRVSTTDTVASALVVVTSPAPPNKPPAPTETSTMPIVAVPPPAGDTKPAGRGPRKVADPELTNVVGQVSAGRLSEASQTYASLSSRPEGAVVYAKVASILARRASQSCNANSASAPADCPEIIK